jgi:hypothetical protein
MANHIQKISFVNVSSPPCFLMPKICDVCWQQVAHQKEEINLVPQLEVRDIAGHQKILIHCFLVTKIFVWVPCLQNFHDPI